MAAESKPTIRDVLAGREPLGATIAGMAAWAAPELPVMWRINERQAFVGRQAEFDKLEGVWSAASGGARQVVFVGGEPGSGKSRLVAEAAKSLHRLGVPVVVGRCLSEYGTAYQPFNDAMAAFQPVLDELLPTDSDGPVRHRLQRLFEPGMPHGTDDRPTTDQRRELFDAVATLVGRAAQDGPLVLVLEDLHWAGSSSLQLLAHLVRRLSEARLLVLATHRPTPPDRSEPLVAAIADLYRLDGVHRIDLEGLNTDEITELLTRTAKLPTPRIRPFAATLRDQTGGNPFFLWELWHGIAARGGLSSLRAGELQVPATVRDALAGRLRQLDQPDRELVELAAVAGDEVDLAVLVATSRHGRDSVLQAVDRAVEVGLLEATGDGLSYRFPHTLARQAVLTQVPPGREADEHARIAGHLEEHFTGTTGEVERLAYHYSQAHGHGLDAQARNWLVEASRLAVRALAHAEAAHYLEQAARFAADVPDRQQLLLAAIDAHVDSGNPDRAQKLSETILGEATDAATRLEAAIRYSDSAPYATGSVSRAVDFLHEILPTWQHDPTDSRYIRGLASLGQALALSGNPDEADQLSSKAIGLARHLGQDEVLAYILMASLWNSNDPAMALRQRDRAAEAAKLANRLGDLRTLGPVSVFRAMHSYVVGDADEIADAQAALARVAERALPYQGFWAAQIEYGRRFLQGDFAGAQASADAARDLGVRFSGDDTEGVYGLQTFMINRETGALEQVRPLVTGRERPQAHWAPGLLTLYTELGMRKPAARVLSWLLEQDLARYRSSADWPAVLAFLVEGALAQRDAAALRRLRPMLAEYEGYYLVAGHFVALCGSADRYLGSVDSILDAGDPDAEFAAAAAMETQMKSVVHEATTLAAHAAHLSRRGRGGDARKARELATRARALAEPIGQHRVLRMLEPTQGAARGPDATGLTAREHDVLQLLAEGRSNREIAEMLVIAENTAANHVGSILLKTGAANRTQAASRAISRGWLRID
jgi:DNA-binding CsgD family transcriptional regulator